MSGWSRTTKPSADKTIAANTIFGVDRNEIAVTKVPSHVGWVKRTTVGQRVKTEVLVAMKTPPVEDNADDTVFPDTVITFTAQPEDITVTAPAPAAFSVTATASPAATLTYQWQFSGNGGTSWTNIAAGGTDYSGQLTANLTVNDSTGGDGLLYRCVVTGTNTGATLASDPATLTVE